MCFMLILCPALLRIIRDCSRMSSKLTNQEENCWHSNCLFTWNLKKMMIFNIHICERGSLSAGKATYQMGFLSIEKVAKPEKSKKRWLFASTHNLIHQIHFTCFNFIIDVIIMFCDDAFNPRQLFWNFMHGAVVGGIQCRGFHG